MGSGAVNEEKCGVFLVVLVKMGSLLNDFAHM